MRRPAAVCWPSKAALAFCLAVCACVGPGTGLAAEPDPLAAIRDAVPACGDGVETCVGLVLHLVVDQNGPAQSPAWIASQVAVANQHFAAVGVAFELTEVAAVEARHATVVDKQQRDELGRSDFSRGVVHWYVVSHLMNVDDVGEIYGVHWRDREQRSRRWVIVSGIAWEVTLAHELGHFFGLKHSDYAVSIMNKTPRSTPPAAERTFAEDELKVVRKRLRRMLRRGDVVAR